MSDDPSDEAKRMEPNETVVATSRITMNSPLTLGAKGRWSTAAQPAEAMFVYDRKTIVLHWCTAILVALLWLVAQIIDDFPAGPLRVDARSVHMSLGLTLAVVLAVRVHWRSRGSGALSPIRAGLLDRAAAIGHWALYALAILALTLGVCNALARGDHIFNLFSLPELARGNKPMRDLVGTLHGWVANSLVFLAIGHAVVALFHHYVLGDGLLWRILPRKWFAR
jgi:cytochrome b561